MLDEFQLKYFSTSLFVFCYMGNEGSALGKKENR